MPDTIPNTLPSLTPSKANLVMGRRVILAIIPEGGSQLNMCGTTSDLDKQVETIPHKNVDPTTLKTYTDREVQKEEMSKIRVTVDEFTDDVMTLWNAGLTEGVGKLWALDPRDAGQATASLLTNEFECSVKPSGAVKLERESHSSLTLEVTVYGALALTKAASLA